MRMRRADNHSFFMNFDVFLFPFVLKLVNFLRMNENSSFFCYALHFVVVIPEYFSNILYGMHFI